MSVEKEGDDDDEPSGYQPPPAQKAPSRQPSTGPSGAPSQEKSAYLSSDQIVENTLASILGRPIQRATSSLTRFSRTPTWPSSVPPPGSPARQPQGSSIERQSVARTAQLSPNRRAPTQQPTTQQLSYDHRRERRGHVSPTHQPGWTGWDAMSRELGPIIDPDSERRAEEERRQQHNRERSERRQAREERQRSQPPSTGNAPGPRLPPTPQRRGQEPDSGVGSPRRSMRLQERDAER